MIYFHILLVQLLQSLELDEHSTAEDKTTARRQLPEDVDMTAQNKVRCCYNMKFISR